MFSCHLFCVWSRIQSQLINIPIFAQITLLTSSLRYRTRKKINNQTSFENSGQIETIEHWLDNLFSSSSSLSSSSFFFSFFNWRWITTLVQRTIRSTVEQRQTENKRWRFCSTHFYFFFSLTYPVKKILQLFH